MPVCLIGECGRADVAVVDEVIMGLLRGQVLCGVVRTFLLCNPCAVWLPGSVICQFDDWVCVQLGVSGVAGGKM